MSCQQIIWLLLNFLSDEVLVNHQGLGRIASLSPTIVSVTDVELTDDSWRPDKKGLRRYTYSRHAVDDRELISEEILPPPPLAPRRIVTENPFSVMSAASKWRGRTSSGRLRRASRESSTNDSNVPQEEASSSTIIVNVIPEEITNDRHN